MALGTTHWTEADDKIIRSVIYQFTEHAVFVSGDDVKPWAPTRRKVIDLLDALVAITVLHGAIDQPCWLDDCKIDAVVSVRNGLLDINQGRLLPHNPLFFNQTSVPFDYDEHALQPKRWLQFLNELWPNGSEAIEVLAQWFGYVISGRTDLHKILLMVGPTRGGKGVIART